MVLSAFEKDRQPRHQSIETSHAQITFMQYDLEAENVRIRWLSTTVWDSISIHQLMNPTQAFNEIKRS